MSVARKRWRTLEVVPDGGPRVELDEPQLVTDSFMEQNYVYRESVTRLVCTCRHDEPPLLGEIEHARWCHRSPCEFGLLLQIVRDTPQVLMNGELPNQEVSTTHFFVAASEMMQLFMALNRYSDRPRAYTACLHWHPAGGFTNHSYTDVRNIDGLLLPNIAAAWIRRLEFSQSVAIRLGPEGGLEIPLDPQGRRVVSIRPSGGWQRALGLPEGALPDLEQLEVVLQAADRFACAKSIVMEDRGRVETARCHGRTFTWTAAQDEEGLLLVKRNLDFVQPLQVVRAADFGLPEAAVPGRLESDRLVRERVRGEFYSHPDVIDGTVTAEQQAQAEAVEFQKVHTNVLQVVEPAKPMPMGKLQALLDELDEIQRVMVRGTTKKGRRKPPVIVRRLQRVSRDLHAEFTFLGANEEAQG